MLEFNPRFYESITKTSLPCAVFLLLRSTSAELQNLTWIARRLLALKGPEVASFQTISCFKTSCDKRRQLTPLGLHLPVGSTELGLLPESTLLEKKKKKIESSNTVNEKLEYRDVCENLSNNVTSRRLCISLTSSLKETAREVF